MVALTTFIYSIKDDPPHPRDLVVAFGIGCASCMLGSVAVQQNLYYHNYTHWMMMPKLPEVIDKDEQEFEEWKNKTLWMANIDRSEVEKFKNAWLNLKRHGWLPGK